MLSSCRREERAEHLKDTFRTETIRSIAKIHLSSCSWVDLIEMRTSRSQNNHEVRSLDNLGNESKRFVSFLFRYAESVVEYERLFGIQRTSPLLRSGRIVVLVQKTVKCVHIRSTNITSQKPLEQQNEMVKLVSAWIGMIDTNPLMRYVYDDRALRYKGCLLYTSPSPRD